MAGVKNRLRRGICSALMEATAAGMCCCLFGGLAYCATRQKLFHFPRDRVIAAALAVAKQDKETRVLESRDAEGEITFRADVDAVGPPDRALGEYWTGLAVRISVVGRGTRSSTLEIAVERVYPARFNNVPQRMSPHAEEEEYAKRFLKRVRSQLGK